nr:MAG TPA_asm: hypothetical protein [Caudoviricetes sp.]
MTEKEAIIRFDFIRCALLGGTKPHIMPNEENIGLVDAAIKALEDVQQYRALEKHLSDMFGGSLSLKMCVDELERILTEPDSPHPMNAKILTYQEAADWEAYREIGTPEECRAAVEKQTETLTVDKAKTIAAKAICIGCGYLADCKCDYNGGNCMVSKPMLESVLKSFDDWNRRADNGKVD